MRTADVKSLYPSVPVKEVINYILGRAFPTEHSRFHDFDKESYRTLLEFALLQGQFLCCGEYYLQLDGVMMGSPLGPVIAELFMQMLEERHMPSLVEKGVVCWFRFVDDIFLLLQSECDDVALLHYMNSLHPNIEFTMEQPNSHGKIAFLDVLVHQKFNDVSNAFEFPSEIYRKASYSGVLLNWSSLIVVIYKIAMIVSMFHRAWCICQYDEKLFSVEVANIFQILKLNGYPSRVIHKGLKQFNKKYKVNLNTSSDNERISSKVDDNLVIPDDNTRFVCLKLPYYNDGMVDFRRRMIDLVKEYYPSVMLRVVFQSPTKIRQFFPIKDKIPKPLRHRVVYKL
jgi:hypothetical protein